MERSEGDMSLKNSVTPPGIDPGTVRLVAQRLNHYAIPGPNCSYTTETKLWATFLGYLILCGPYISFLKVIFRLL
jgi:hypothetical protein